MIVENRKFKVKMRKNVINMMSVTDLTYSKTRKALTCLASF